MSQTTMTTQSLAEPAEAGGGLTRRGVLLTLVLMAMAVFACRDAWLDIIRIVQVDEEASHILLVPLVFARIAWVRRSELKGVATGVSFWGPAIALGGVGLWLFGNIKAIQVFWHFGAILAMFGAFVTINGLAIVRRLWPAFLVLVFLMPLPGVIRHPLALFLQNVSAHATEVVIVALGFELVRHGNLLIINDYPVGIAEACNGMRMVSMLILVVFAFVFSEKVRPWVRVALIVLAVPLAIACNIVRLVPTVLAYGYFSPEFADQVHDWLGWVMVIASYFMLMGLLALMRWLLLPTEPLPVIKRRRPRQQNWFTRLMGGPDGDETPRGRWQLPGSMFAIILVFAAAYAIGRSLPDGSEADGYHAQVREVAKQLPREIGPWKSIDTELPDAAVALLRPNVLISRRYIEDKTERAFALLIVQCADARDMEGHYPPNCYPAAGWAKLRSKSVALEIGSLDATSMDYRFERGLQDGNESISVVNLIVVPKDGFATSMGSIRRLGGTVSDRYYGAAQVQFVFDGQWEEGERLAVVQQVGDTFEPLIRVIMDKTSD
ncbi:MAG: exosortase-associated EpsI family protein [Phycisphaeraceae bacterium]|nr:exosortase-associated EpsI family protein [Phycisphaeraceae bacterium]